MVTQITVFECSPPVIIDQASQDHLDEMVSSMNVSNSNSLVLCICHNMCKVV